jgi:serine/threonine protein kinase
VLLSEDLRASVADLGLMQALASSSSDSSVGPSGGAAAGGPSSAASAGQREMYAAPEQLASGQRCSVAVDLFSFGVLLIELTTQQLAGKRGEWRLPRVPRDCPQVSHGHRGGQPARRAVVGTRVHAMPCHACLLARQKHGATTQPMCPPGAGGGSSDTVPVFRACLQGVLTLIEECTSPDPSKRPTAPQALQRVLAAGR